MGHGLDRFSLLNVEISVHVLCIQEKLFFLSKTDILKEFVYHNSNISMVNQHNHKIGFYYQ